MSDKEYNPRLPTKMEISIASANEAIEYWLNNVVLKENIKVKDVYFSKDTHFTITFNRT